MDAGAGEGLDLNEIRVFATVVERGSFTAAAESLGLPKSTVSRRVARLEDRLGLRLLQRTTRQLRLTEAGTTYYARVADALASLDEAHVAMAETQGAPRGTLRITAPVDFGERYLGELVTTFVRRFPDVTVDVELSGRTVDLVTEGFDLALRAGVLRDSSLIARKLGGSEAALFASPAYLDRVGRPKRADDLVHHECVLFGAARQNRRWSLVGPDGEEIPVRVQSRIMGNEFSFVREAILAGAGIGLVPSFLCRPDVEAGRLERVLDGYGLMPGAAVYLVYPSARHLSPKVAVFRDFVVEWFAGRDWGTAPTHV